MPKTNFKDLKNINFNLKKNDSLVQQGNTGLMLWGIDEIISYISRFFTLKKGDVIFTGTPAGVGKINANDYLSGTLENEQMFSLKIK